MNHAVTLALAVAGVKLHARALADPVAASARFDAAVAATAAAHGLTPADVRAAVDRLTPDSPYDQQRLVLSLLDALA